jgi:hypothetical protein
VVMVVGVLEGEEEEEREGGVEGEGAVNRR